MLACYRINNRYNRRSFIYNKSNENKINHNSMKTELIIDIINDHSYIINLMNRKLGLIE